MNQNAQEHVHHIVAVTTALTGLCAEDEKRLHQHRDFLISLRDEIVQAFYDQLFGYAETAAIFKDGERAAREETLVDWIGRTVSDQISDSYWMWQWVVGLVHIKRRVTNPMMISMMSRVQSLVLEKAVEKLGPDEGIPLYLSFKRVTTTVAALIAEGYTTGSLEAVAKATGMSSELVKVNIETAIDDELAAAYALVAA